MHTPTLFKAAEQFFNEHDVNFADEGDGRTLTFVWNNDGVRWRFAFVCEADPGRLEVMAFAEITVREAHRATAARVVSALNHVTQFGYYVLGGKDDDRFAFRYTMPCFPSMDPAEVIQFAMGVAADAFVSSGVPLAALALQGGDVESTLQAILDDDDNEETARRETEAGELVVGGGEMLLDRIAKSSSGLN